MSDCLSLLAPAASVLLAVATEGHRAQLAAYDIGTGTLRWERKLASSRHDGYGSKSAHALAAAAETGASRRAKVSHVWRRAML